MTARLNAAVLKGLEGTVTPLLPQHLQPSHYLRGMLTSQENWVKSLPASSLRLRLASEAPTKPDAHFIMNALNKPEVTCKLKENLMAQLQSALSTDVDISSE